MSDVSRGPDWWQASDGQWYPPKESENPPAPGWWLAADGKWYAPERRVPAPGSSASSTTSSVANASGPKARSQKDATPATPPRVAKKPVAAKRPVAAKKPVVTKKPVAAKKPVPGKKPITSEPITSEKPAVKPAPNPVERPRRTSRTPLEQIEARNEASREDAVTLAPSRFAAATRALSTLSIEIDLERSAADARVDRLSTPSTSPVRPKETGSKSTDPKTRDIGAASAKKPAPAKSAESGGTTSRASSPVPSADGSPLLEVKPSPLATDVDHIGDRLAIFTDRVELRDRSDHIRQVILGDDITDVVVHRRRMGSVLTIENVDGPAIVAKGLRPEQADAARDVIMRKTRPARAIARKSPTSPAPEAPRTGTDTKTSSTSPEVDEGHLLRALAVLHRAGVLTDAEFDEKVVVVGRLARGESLTRSGS